MMVGKLFSKKLRFNVDEIIVAVSLLASVVKTRTGILIGLFGGAIWFDNTLGQLVFVQK